MCETKVCRTCGKELCSEEFYVISTKDGVERRDSKCKSCTKEINRVRYAENPEYKTKRKLRQKQYMSDPDKVEAAARRSEKFYGSIRGRAKTLFKSAERRSSQYNEFDITADWIEDRLLKGVCEITGIPFDFNTHPKYDKNPFAPSIDRMDSTKGYTMNNVRIVLWQVNLMRGEMTDEEVLGICKAVVEGLTHESQMDF
jgi:hypothetical protein